jgi:hypothetical protein
MGSFDPNRTSVAFDVVQWRGVYIDAEQPTG